MFICSGTNVLSEHKGIDRFANLLDKHKLEWDFYHNPNLNQHNVCIEAKGLLFYFDYSFRYPLYRIGYKRTDAPK